MYVGRNNLLNRYLITWEHNVVRWCELILVMVCLLLSILMFYKKIFITTKIVHAAVDAAFLFIIATDVLSWCVKTPMTIKTWMVISSAGFLMYCFNAGLLLFYKRRTAVGLIIFNIVANIITAIVFLLDCIWICWEYIHADYKTVQNVDPRIFPGGTGPRIKSMTSLQGRNLVDRAVSACFLLEINEFECPVARKRKGNVVYPIVRPLRPMSYGGTFPVDKDLAPLSSGGSYKGISTQVSGITMSPCQTARSRRSARPVSTAEGGDPRRSTMDHSQECYCHKTPEGRSIIYTADMDDPDAVPEREYIDELSPEEEGLSYADQRGAAPDFSYRSFTSSEPPVALRTPVISVRSVSPPRRGASTSTRCVSPCERVMTTTWTSMRSVSPSQRPPQDTSYRSQVTGYSDPSQRTSVGCQRTATNRQTAQGRFIESIAEEDITQ